MAQIIIFTTSLFFIIFIISFRLIELKKGKDILSTTFRDSCDKLILKIYRWFIVIFYNVFSSSMNFLKKIFLLFIHFFVDIWEFLVRKSVKYIDSIRGKGALKKKGSVSFFLSRLEEYKKEVRR